MAPSTSKKQPQPGSQQGTLLGFWKKETKVKTVASANRRRVSEDKLQREFEEVEGIFTSSSKIPRSSPALNRNGKCEEKAKNGSMNDPVVISDDDDIEIAPLPTSSKRRKVSQSPAIRSSVKKANDQPNTPPMFRDCPEFKPPPAWPQVINTAPNDDVDGEEMPPSDEDDTRTQDPEDGDMEEDDSGVEMDDQELSPQRPALFRDESGPGNLEGAMEWEEPEDEGMGMEDEDEGYDGSIADERRGLSRSASSTPKKVEKVNECPVCGKNLKAKVNTVVQHHINQCLDSSSSSTSQSISNPAATHRVSSFSFSAPSSPPLPQVEPATKGPNAFNLLMSGHKEREQWKDAEADLKRDGKRTIGRRKAPFYKVMTGMPVAVDAFRYGKIPGVTAYLLTHAHSDHYTNLSKGWSHGPIYCSQTTANLIVHMLDVDPKWVHGLPDDVPFEMPNTGGVTVTPITANHCPGSSLFLFEGPQSINAGDSGFTSPYVGSKRIFRYLHCGDFRANPKMVLHPAIAKAPIHTCYLDTTYLNPKYCFPPQPLVINACASLARQTVLGASEDAPTLQEVRGGLGTGVSTAGKVTLKTEGGTEVEVELEVKDEGKEKNTMAGWLVKKEHKVKEELTEELQEVRKQKGRTLVVIGTYSIGKERIVKAVAKALNSTIYCDQRKKGILLCQTDPELHSLLSTDPIKSQVHLLPLGNIQLERLEPYLARLHPHFDRVIGYRPTGWSYSPPAGTDMMPDVNTIIRRDQARRFSEGDLKTMRGSSRKFMLYGVPYSEHSSFFELTCFALSLPGPDLKMIATVNVGNEKSRGKMKKWFEKWLAEKGKRRAKGLPSVVEYRDETYW